MLTPTPTPTPFNPIGHFIPTRTPTPTPGVTATTFTETGGDSFTGLLLFWLSIAAIIAALSRRIK